jgi:hypothetical protein
LDFRHIGGQILVEVVICFYTQKIQ